MKIAITGAAGWLGRKVTAALSESDELVLVDSVAPDEATVFDSTSPTGRVKAPLSPDWPYFQSSILAEDELAVALSGVECVVHLAAWPTGDWDRASATMNTNVMGTYNVFQQSRIEGVRRVVNASSVNAFGSFYWRVSTESPVRRALPLSEDEEAVPEDPYSLSKLVTEMVGATFARAFGMEAVNLRFAGVWTDDRYQQALSEGLPESTGLADDLFQWVHEDDVTQGIVQAVRAPAVTPEPMVIGARDTCAPEPTLDLIKKYRPDLLPYIREPIAGRSALVSISRARIRLGYEPTKSFG